jgi:hypothetical protein
MTRNYTYNTPGLNNVGSYQMAGLPYLSGSEGLDAGEEDRHTFPQVAKSVTVVNHGSQHIRIAFAPTGSMNTPSTTHHYITLSGTAATAGLSGSTQFSLNGRMKDVYISNPAALATRYEIYAELTNIASGEMLTPTGSGISL